MSGRRASAHQLPLPRRGRERGSSARRVSFSIPRFPPRPMTPESVIAFGQHALYVAILVAAPLLLTALAVGLLIGVIQAATQINEMTLSFIPKLIAMAVVALITGPWMLRTLVQFTRQLIEGLPGTVK